MQCVFVTNDGLIHQVQGKDAEGSKLSLSHVALQEGYLAIGVEKEVCEEAGKSGLAQVGLSQKENSSSWGEEKWGRGVAKIFVIYSFSHRPHVLAIATHLCAEKCRVPKSTMS